MRRVRDKASSSSLRKFVYNISNRKIGEIALFYSKLIPRTRIGEISKFERGFLSSPSSITFEDERFQKYSSTRRDELDPIKRRSKKKRGYDTRLLVGRATIGSYLLITYSWKDIICAFCAAHSGEISAGRGCMKY